MTDVSIFMHGEDASPVHVIAPRVKARKPGSIAERTRQSRQFWLIYALTYPIFFLATVGTRVAHAGAPQTGTSRGLFSEAHELASASIPYAFMG